MQKIDFEKSLSRLEEITQQLESGELSLDDSLGMFEEGIKLSRFCEKKLTEAEQKLEILKSIDINTEDLSEPDRDKKNLEDDEQQSKKKSKKSKLINTDINKESFLF